MLKILQNSFLVINIVTVFHRILDFKTGLNVYSDPFFILNTPDLYIG
jgi:hypothetical protein